MSARNRGTNEYEVRNRSRKADALVDQISTRGVEAGWSLAKIAQAAERLDAAGREAAEREAAVIPGSDETWALVISRLYRRAEIAADPFAGLPGVSA